MASKDIKLHINAKDNTRTAFKSVESKMGRLNRSFGGIRTQMAGVGAAIGGLVGKNIAQSVDKMHKLSVRLGTTTEALSKLGYVAKISGVSFNTMTMGLQRMTRRIAEASHGAGEAQGALRELGIDARKLAGMKLDDQFSVLAEALSKVGNQSDKVRLAMKLFDSEGVALLQTMENGAKGVSKLSSELDKLGGTISGANAKAIADMNDSWGRLSEAIGGVATKITASVAPAITGLNDAMTLLVSSPMTALKVMFLEVLILIEKFNLGVIAVIRSIVDFVVQNDFLSKGLDKVGISLGTVTDGLDKMETDVLLNITSLNTQITALEGTKDALDKVKDASKSDDGWSLLPDFNFGEFGNELGKLTQGFDNLERQAAKFTTKFIDDISVGLTNALMTGKASFKDFAKSVIAGLIQMIIKMQLLKAITAIFPGIAPASPGSVSIDRSSLGLQSLNTQGFTFSEPTKFAAAGGTVKGGQSVIVGEHGKEMFRPNTAGRIIPNREMDGGAPLHVTFQINAVDTQSGTAFLMKNQKHIVGMIDQAYRKQGRTGVTA
jgi:hypothetical protein